MSIFGFLTFGTRPDSSAESANIDGPSPAVSASGTLSRTASKESLASRAMTREKAFRARQVSRQASLSSAEDRAAESARRHRKKQAMKHKPQVAINPFKRCLNFFITFIPFLGTPATPADTPSNLSPASSILSLSSHHSLVFEAEEPCSEVPTDVSDGNSDNGDDGASQVSTDVSDSNLTDAPNASTDVSTVLVSAPRFSAKGVRSREDNSMVRHQIELLNRERETVASAIRYAQEEERKRVARVQLFEHQKAKFGENAAIWMQFNRDAAEEQERRRLQRIEDMALDELDVEERRELLLQGQQAVSCRVEEYHEKVVQEDQEIPQFLYLLDTHRDSLDADMRALRAGFTSSEEHLRVVDSAKLGTPKKTTSCYHYTRDRTTIRRSMYSRYHPYATFVRPARSTNGRYFNNCDASRGFIVNRFKLYDNSWRWLATPVQEADLSFSDIPWPLVAVPNTPEDVTPERVIQFLILKHYGSAETRAEHHRWVARYELQKHWFPDHIEKWIVPRIAAGAECHAVRVAADRVQKALVVLMASE